MSSPRVAKTWKVGPTDINAMTCMKCVCSLVLSSNKEYKRKLEYEKSYYTCKMSGRINNQETDILSRDFEDQEM